MSAFMEPRKSAFTIAVWVSLVFSGSLLVDCHALAQSLAERVQPLVDAHRGNISVAIRNLNSGEIYQHNPDQVMPTASLIKFPLMVATYGRIARGELTLDQRIILKDTDKVPGSGILTEHFSAGADLSLRDLIHLMIVYSDNTATNLVAEQTGLKLMNEEIAKLSLFETRMNSLVYRRDLSIDPHRSELYGLGSTTAGEMVQLLEMLEQDKLYGPEFCEQMKQHMLACDDSTKLKRYLPRSVPVAHKSGEISSARCEAGLIYGESGPIAICVLTAENENQEFHDDHPAHVLIGRIAEQAWRHFNPKGFDVAEAGTLKNGSTGILVSDLQRTLNARLKPSPGLATDGEFGPATEAAVKQFQAMHRMEPDGVVNETFWHALGSLVDSKTVPDPTAVNSETWPREPADSETGEPFVTAQAWAVLDGDSGTLLGGFNENDSREIASTTKIMTAHVILQLASSEPEIFQERVTFSQRAFTTEGSAAELRPGESVTVDELMYGLLLPSGNDAAVALAEHFGRRAAEGLKDAEKLNDPLELFILAMNHAARELKLEHTHFTNPNGLPNPENFSSASDLARLAHATWQSEAFRRYVGTPQFGCEVNGPGGYERSIAWRNTNKLLGIEGYDGIKTGSTNAAGACLVAHSTRGNQQRIVVVLGCPASESRYTDTRNLFRWSWSLK